MEHVRGLAPKTRDMALRIVGRLLTVRFDGGAIDISAIKPEHVRRFFAQQAKLYSKPASAGSVVASLRGYFRYRASLGDLVHGLVGTERRTRSCDSCRRCNYAQTSPAPTARRHRGRRHPHPTTCA